MEKEKISWEGVAEMKQIPDYPNYAVTKDGRVWSYYKERFLKARRIKAGYQVMLYFQGMQFSKLVHRLVFETFMGYSPECVVRKDKDVYNSSLDNLIGLTQTENAILSNQKSSRVKKIIYKVDIESGKKQILEILSAKGHKYSGVYHCLENKPQNITYKGGLYYYEGEKEELVAEIKARIKCNELILPNAYYAGQITVIKKYISRYKKYLEILEKV